MHPSTYIKASKSLRVLVSIMLILSISQQATKAATKSHTSARVSTPPPTPETTIHPPDTIRSSAVEVTSAATMESWRKTPPTVPPPRPFKLPTITKYKLDNGLNVQLVEDHRVPFITIGLGIKAGEALEPTDELGLADMTADMLTEGTTTKKSLEIADEIDFIGGGLKAVSDYDFSIVSGSALSNYQDRLLDLLTDVALHPSFPEDELTLKKTNLLEELVMKRSQPEFLVEERFNKVLFGAHPYAVVAPTKETVSRITRADLQKFHDQHFLPNDGVLVIVGDFDTTKIKDKIEHELGASQWKPGHMPTAEMPSLPKQNGRRIYLVDRPGSVQSSLKIGNVGIKKTDPDYFSMIVANQILGGAAHSRLFLNIREQKGYTYGAYSSIAARKQPGSFAAEAEVRTDVTGPSLEEFLYELDRIRNTRVSEKELADAKAYIVGSFQLGLETQSGLAQRLLEANLYDLPDNYLETYTNNVMAVKVDDVRRVARRLIDNGNIVIAVVGDAEKIKSELELFGPVEVYDISGKLSSESGKNPIPGS